MRRWVAIVLAAFAVLALSACDPSETSGRTNGINLEVLVNADGSGTAQMYLDDTQRSEAQLRTWGQAVGARLFPHASLVDVRVDPNSGGYPFVVIDATGLYEPGPAPRVPLDTRDAVGWLLANGTKTVDVVIDSPRVPLTSSWTPPRGQEESTWYWSGIKKAEAAPVGELVLAPSLWLGVLPVLLTLAAGVLLVASFVLYRRRHRVWAMGLAAAAVVPTAVVVIVAGAVLPNNLGVAGVVSSTWVSAAALLTLLSLLLIPAAIVCFVLYAVLRPRTATATGLGEPDARGAVR